MVWLLFSTAADAAASSFSLVVTELFKTGKVDIGMRIEAESNELPPADTNAKRVPLLLFKCMLFGSRSADPRVRCADRQTVAAIVVYVLTLL